MARVLKDYLIIADILRIDHLWLLKGLQKLSLSNNIIEKIENLEELTNLTELNLSFNKITVIENLEKLVNLEVLSLYGNLIEKLENLENLEKLEILSVGANKIEDNSSILCLRYFENLKSLNLAQNPCSDQNPMEFRKWIMALLPNLKYYEYQLIWAEERAAAILKFKDEIKIVEAAEKEITEERERIKAEKAEEALNAGSFVEFLGDDFLFNKLFDGDVDGNLILSVPKVGIQKCYEQFKEDFCLLTRQLFEIGQAKFKERETEVDQFLKCVEGEREANYSTSRQIIEEFIGNMFFTYTVAASSSTIREEVDLVLNFKMF